MSINSIQKELKKLERKEQLLAKKRQALLEQQNKLQNNTEQVKKLFESSGFSTPAELVQALSAVYGLRGVKLSTRTRKHTRVDATLRDLVKKELAAKTPKTQIMKKFDISFPVISKIEKGGYDKL
jgi:hypothetical protein